MQVKNKEIVEMLKNNQNFGEIIYTAYMHLPFK